MAHLSSFQINKGSADRNERPLIARRILPIGHNGEPSIEVQQVSRGRPLVPLDLQRAVMWFAAQAVAVRRVMSDNGSGYVERQGRALHSDALT